MVVNPPLRRHAATSMRLTRLAITTAPALFVLLWSTGFIGARYGLPYIEPLNFLAVRMVFAVVIMAGIALVGGASSLEVKQIWLFAEVRFRGRFSGLSRHVVLRCIYRLQSRHGRAS